MEVSIIAAIARNRVIGKNNKLPWYLPQDLKHFRELTIGHSLLMGRKTYQSIGRALPGRQNLILSRDPAFAVEGCEIFREIPDVFKFFDRCEKLFVIGGQSLFETLIPRAHRLFLTLIDADFNGDTFFPMYDESQWIEVNREEFGADLKTPFSYSFIEYHRKKNQE